jgi:hypothetical protein
MWSFPPVQYPSYETLAQEAAGADDARDDAIMVTIGYSSSFIENPGTVTADLGESLLKRRDSRKSGPGIIRGRRTGRGSTGSSPKVCTTMMSPESS